MSNAAPAPMNSEVTACFGESLRVHFRPLRPTDANLLKEFFCTHTEQTIVHHYFAQIRHLSPEQIHDFVSADRQRNFALVGLITHDDRERAVCVARYCAHPFRAEAEVAVAVHDQFQGLGMGTFLVRQLIRIARENEIATFTAKVLADNHPMLLVFRKVAPMMQTNHQAGAVHVRFGLTGLDSETPLVK